MRTLFQVFSLQPLTAECRVAEQREDSPSQFYPFWSFALTPFLFCVREGYRLHRPNGMETALQWTCFCHQARKRISSCKHTFSTAESCVTAWPQLPPQARWHFHPAPSRIHAGATVSPRSLLDILLQRNKNWNSVYLLQMTNESIKLSREITQEKKMYPPRNQIIFEAVTGSDKPQPVKLQKFIVHWRAAKYGPVAALPSPSWILSAWPLKRALCSPWIWS